MVNENRYPHLRESARQVVEAGDVERIMFTESPHWIGYPKALGTIKILEEMLDRPPHPRTQNLLLIGEPGNGKTTIVSHLADLRGKPYQDESGDAVKPIVIAEAPPSADEKALYISILKHFWGPRLDQLPVTRLRYQVIHLMRASRTRMLIIDEIHSMLTGSPNKLRETMNALKLLCNELKIPIVGVGTIDAVRVLHSDRQHSSRFDVVNLPTWDPNAEFQQLIKAFEGLLPLRNPSGLYERDIARRLHFISEGRIGQLRRILVGCAVDAIKNHQETITPEQVERYAWVRSSNGIRQIPL